jgi:uncharacterized protein
MLMTTASTTIPVREECLRLMEAHDMLPNIRAHSLTVSRFAVAIARAANDGGCDFHLPAIEAAALLHDITKTRSLATGENHARTGASLLRELGYAAIAGMVEEHVTPTDHGGELTAGELISYADKRVLHDRVVSIDERFGYLYERYGRDEQAVQRISRARIRTQEIENKLRALLNGAAHAIIHDFT